MIKTIILSFGIVISHVVSSARIPLCSGGSALLGLEEWNDNQLLCCEASGDCHGYNASAIEANVKTSLQILLNSSLPISKTTPNSQSRFASNRNEPKFHEEEPLGSPCCSSKVSVFYPIVGVSAISGKRVAVVQIHPFRQPVVYEQCAERSCRILRGNCTQVYWPQPLYILTADADGKLAAKLDFVLVEAGCECVSSAPLSGRLGVDGTVIQALKFITGTDFDEDYLAALASVAEFSNQATTSTSSIAPAIDPQESTITSTESSHDLDEVTSVPTTTMPLPDLPDNGQPILIPAGHFNPVIASIQKFILG